jgi:hypothetical protein
MLKRLNQAWKQDRLGVLGVGVVLAGFVVFVSPIVWIRCDDYPFYFSIGLPIRINLGCVNLQAFNLWNFPAFATSLVIGCFLLLLRRR